MMPEHVRKLAYSIVEQVIKEIQKKLEINVRKTFYGKKLPHTNSSYKIFRNFDFKQTIEKNLKNYSREHGQLSPTACISTRTYVVTIPGISSSW